VSLLVKHDELSLMQVIPNNPDDDVIKEGTSSIDQRPRYDHVPDQQSSFNF
jgi:hypothetical protein